MPAQDLNRPRPSTRQWPTPFAHRQCRPDERSKLRGTKARRQAGRRWHAHHPRATRPVEHISIYPPASTMHRSRPPQPLPRGRATPRTPLALSPPPCYDECRPPTSAPTRRPWPRRGSRPQPPTKIDGPMLRHGLPEMHGARIRAPGNSDLIPEGDARGGMLRRLVFVVA